MAELPSLFALKAFVLASQCHSFTKTAEIMCLTQGAVSRQIKQLEEQLGVSLFVREHHLVRLTSEGQKILPYFRQALDCVHEGMGALQRGGKTHLWLNIAPTFSTRWLVPRLSGFFTQYPEINVTITTDYDPREEYHEHADCQVRFGTGPLDSAESQLLFREENVLVGLPHLTAQARDLRVLLSRNTHLHILGGYDRLDIWEQWRLLAGVEVDEHTSDGLSFSTMDQAINAVLTGVGIALLDRNMIIKEIDSGELVVLSDIISHGPYGYWLDSRPSERKAGALRLFTGWLLEERNKMGRGKSEKTHDAER